MRTNPNEPSSIASEEEDAAFDRAVDTLANIFTDSAKSQHQSELESFSMYTQKIHNECHKTLSCFRTRFARGYQVLMKKVKEQNAASEMKKPGLGPWIKA